MTRLKTLLSFVSVLILAGVFGMSGAAPAVAQPVEARAIAELEIRSAPGLQFPFQFVVPAGQFVGILTCTQDYIWCEVSHVNGTGWTEAQYLEVTQANQAGPAFGPLLQLLLDALGVPQQPAPAPQPPPPPPPPVIPVTPAANEVCFYRDADFASDAFCVGMGATELLLSSQWNNAITSIRVGANASVLVCGDANYGGWCLTYFDDTNLTDFRNDSISSYRTVLPVPPPPAPPANQQISARPSVAINARSGPSTQYPVQFILPQNVVVSVVGCVADYGWCEVLYSGQFAWTAARFLVATQSGLLISDYGAQLGVPVVQPPPPPPPTPGPNDVCFYQESGFAGAAFCAAIGQSDFSLASPWNDTISSIRIGANAAVTVCGDINLAGWCRIYTDDVNLTGIRNNAISSYQAFAEQPPTPTQAHDARAIVSLNARSGPSTEYLVQFVIPSSALVGVRGCLSQFTWCEIAYGGQSAWVAARFLIATQSGLRVSDYGAQLGIPVIQPPLPPLPPAPTPGPEEVCFYRDANYSGEAFCVGTGQTNYRLDGIWNDSISSIRVGANASVAVCGDLKLTGWCEIYDGDINLAGFRNDSVSSYRVIANELVTGAGVCVYEFAFFTGAAICLGPDQTLATLPAAWNDRISSIRVGDDYSAQVCRDPDFGGWCEEYVADTPQLAADRDNAISSLRTR